jgi:hypothetical protein
MDDGKETSNRLIKLHLQEMCECDQLQTGAPQTSCTSSKAAAYKAVPLPWAVANELQIDLEAVTCL